MKFLSFTQALILSICLHLLVSGLVFIYQLTELPPARETVSIDILPPTVPVGAQNRSKRSPPSQPLKQQIVEQEKAVNNQKPEDSRFLSAFDQKVEKQTVAANKGQFKNVKDPVSGKALKVNGERSAEKQKGGEKSKPRLTDLSPEFNPLAIKERQQQRQGQVAKGGDWENQDGGETSQTDDYIRDVNRGEQTLLNAREFKYYTYYTRIRRQLSHHWEPKVRQKLVRLFRQGRSIASDQDHITKLLIILNGNGTLMKVQVLGASGVRDLDDAAMEAFQSAAPFPNPPKGIIEADGTVKIRWDFVLES